MTDVLELSLDPEHPTPLYHQIATAIRWKIGTGALGPGDLLPPLRAASRAWEVSYHTVRRAYTELAKTGLVEPARGNGTRVLDTDLDSAGSGIDGADGGSAVFVVECNHLQATDLAGQVTAACSVPARPWHLARDGEPPRGMIVGTRFHQGEILQRWPHRAMDVTIGALRIDTAIPERIRRALVGQPVVLVEQDVGTGRQHADDFVAVLPTPVDIRVVTDVPTLAMLEAQQTVHIIAPRLSDNVDPAILTHPRVLVPRYVFDPHDLQTMRRTLARRLRATA